MLANFLQDEVLQNGLNDYLDTYKYTNVETKDLWNSLSRSTNHTLDIKVHFLFLSHSLIVSLMKFFYIYMCIFIKSCILKGIYL